MNRAWEGIDSGAMSVDEKTAHAGASREPTTKGVPVAAVPGGACPLGAAPRRDQEVGQMSNGHANGGRTWMFHAVRLVIEAAIIIVTMTVWAQNMKADQRVALVNFDNYKEAQAKDERERRLRELTGDRKHDELVDAYHDLREELVSKGVIDPRRSRRLITNSGVREGD